MTNNEDMNKQEVPEEELPETEDQAAEDAEQTAGTEGAPEEKPADEAKEAAAQEAESERYSRLFAEFQNYKRRTEKEKSDLYAYAGEKFATALLEVIDNIERAMDAKPEGDKFADGMELILVQLKGVLEKNKVEEIKA